MSKHHYHSPDFILNKFCIHGLFSPRYPHAKNELFYMILYDVLFYMMLHGGSIQPLCFWAEVRLCQLSMTSAGVWGCRKRVEWGHIGVGEGRGRLAIGQTGSGICRCDLSWILVPLLASLELHWSAQICASDTAQDLRSPIGVARALLDYEGDVLLINLWNRDKDNHGNVRNNH